MLFSLVFSKMFCSNKFTLNYTKRPCSTLRCNNFTTIFSFLREQTESIEVFDIDIKTDQNLIVRIEY